MPQPAVAPATRASPSPPAGHRWPGSGLLREPERGLLVLAGALLIASALVPWAQGTNAGGQPLSVRPTEGLGEGVWMLFSGVLLVALGAGRLIVETTNRLLQLIPAGLAIVVAAMWLNANMLSQRAVATWELGGGLGGQTVGPLVAGAGVVATVAAALLLELRRPDEVRRQTKSFGAELGINRRGVLGVLIAGALGLLGGALALGLTVAAFGMRGMLPAILLGTFGFLVGVSIGGRLARRLNAGA